MHNKEHKCSNHKHCCCEDTIICDKVKCCTKIINKTPTHTVHHKCIERNIIRPPVVKHIYDCAHKRVRSKCYDKCSSKRCTNGSCINKFHDCKYIKKYIQQTSCASSVSSLDCIKCSRKLCSGGRCVTHSKNCKYVKKYLKEYLKEHLKKYKKNTSYDSSDCESSDCDSSDCDSSDCNVTTLGLQIYDSSYNHTKHKRKSKNHNKNHNKNRNNKKYSVFLKKKCTSD